jgi:hypothetical protein
VKKVYQLDGSMAFDDQKLLFDIAILEVDNPFILNKFIIPAKLPTVKPAVGKSLIVSGWGWIKYGNVLLNCNEQLILHDSNFSSEGVKIIFSRKIMKKIEIQFFK